MENNAIAKELRPINNGKANNTRDPLHFNNGKHQYKYIHGLTSWILSAARTDVRLYFSQRTNDKHNNVNVQLTVWPELLLLLSVSFARSFHIVSHRSISFVREFQLKLGGHRVNDCDRLLPVDTNTDRASHVSVQYNINA